MKLSSPRLMMTKDAECLDHGMSYMVSIKSLMDNALGINTTDVITLSETKEKTMIQFSVAKTDEDMLKFCDKVGYAYCREKRHKALLVSEYIRYRIQTIQTTDENQRQALKLFDNGVGKSVIARDLGVTYGVVSGWITRRETILQTKTYLPVSAMKIDEFLEDAGASKEKGTY